jgi:hypothetical protein
MDRPLVFPEIGEDFIALLAGAWIDQIAKRRSA